MYLRRKRNKNGSVSIVMVDKSGRSYREIKVIGTSSDADELERFALGAGRWMAHDGGQLELDFDESERVFRRHERCVYNIGFNTFGDRGIPDLVLRCGCQAPQHLPLHDNLHDTLRGKIQQISIIRQDL